MENDRAQLEGLIVVEHADLSGQLFLNPQLITLFRLSCVTEFRPLATRATRGIQDEETGTFEMISREAWHNQPKRPLCSGARSTDTREEDTEFHEPTPAQPIVRLRRPDPYRLHTP